MTHHFADVQPHAAMLWPFRRPSTTTVQGVQSMPTPLDFVIESIERVSTLFPTHPHPLTPYSTYHVSLGCLSS